VEAYQTARTHRVARLIGRAFVFLHFVYLQLGELPRAKSVLSKEDINALESQADFLGLTGLVDLCKATKDVLKGLKGTGDYDLTPISDFSFHVDTSYTQCYEDANFAEMTYERSVDFEMKYTHQGDTVVSVDGTFGDTTGCKCCITKNDTTTTLYNETVVETCQRLHNIVDECYNQNAKDANKISVSSVVQQTDIVPELQLWYAFVIDGMIRSYKKHKNLLLAWDEWGDSQYLIQFLFEYVLGDMKTRSGYFFSGDLRASTRTCTHRISEIK